MLCPGSNKITLNVRATACIEHVRITTDSSETSNFKSVCCMVSFVFIFCRYVIQQHCIIIGSFIKENGDDSRNKINMKKKKIKKK